MARPFVSLCITFIIGILLYGYINISIKASLFLMIFLFLLFLIILFPNQNIIFIHILIILLGVFIYHDQLQYPTILRSHDIDGVAIQGRIQEIAQTHKNYIEYDIKISKIIIGSEEVSINEKARLKYFSSDKLLQPGDKVKINHAVITENFTGEALEGYRRYLRSRGYNLLLEAAADEVEKIEGTSSVNMVYTSYRIRAYIEELFDSSLPAIEGSLLKSILFGNQGYMERDVLDMFSKSGTAHIVAVSGLHIGLIVLLTHWIFKFFKLGKAQILILTMIILFIYSYVVGFPISIIRASSMYYLYVFAYFLNRRYDGINILMMMAFSLLIYNPFYLFSVSFQLSFTATISILLFYSIIKERLNVLPKPVASLLAVTFSAQIGTVPIIAYYFNQISIIAFAANLLIVPVLTPLLAAAFISIFLSLLPIRIEIISNYMINIILTYIHWMTRNLSQLSFASIEIKNINIFYIMVYYVILTIVYLMIWSNKQQMRKGMNTYELQGSNEKAKG